MSLSSSERSRLAMLKSAYDQLITGKKAVRVTIGSKSVEYGAGDIGHLKIEIDQLEARGAGRTRGALRFRV